MMRRRLIPFLVSLIALAGAACVPMTEHSPARGAIFSPLHEGQLSEFDHLLAIDRHTGSDDQWTDVGTALLRLINCEPLPRPSARVEADPTSLAVYQLALLEEQRRDRIATTAGFGQGWYNGTIYEQFVNNHIMQREPGSIDPEQIRWPAMDNVWPDEWPAPIEVYTTCEGLEDRLANTVDTLGLEFDEVDMITQSLVMEWRYSDEAIAALRAVGEDLPEYQEVLQRLRLHRADIALALANQPRQSDAIRDEIDAIVAESFSELRVSPTGDDLAYHARLIWLAMKADEPQVALEHLPHLMAIDHPTVQATAAYYFSKIAWQQGEWQLIVDSSPGLFDEPASLRGAHAYFLATAHLYVDEIDKFLGIARDALRQRRGGEDDPFLGALYRQTLRELARFEVDERTTELLEEFGPRSELNVRILEFSEAAIDLGRPDVASAMVQPLLEQTTDARRLPRLHAVLALAAFLRDDRRSFDRHMDAIIGHRDELHRAIPAHRRAGFFAYQDNELARVLRTMIPIMAEWGDDPTSRAQRQRWLVTITETTQSFLRNAPQTGVSEALTELYHLAGQLLEEHPRGYAERVGAEFDATAPLILGTVQMAPTPDLDRAPQPRLRWAPVYSLLLIPDGPLPPTHFTEDLQLNGEDS